MISPMALEFNGYSPLEAISCCWLCENFRIGVDKLVRKGLDNLSYQRKLPALSMKRIIDVCLASNNDCAEAIINIKNIKRSLQPLQISIPSSFSQNHGH